MEKIVVTPLEVRGYGNVVGDKTKNDLELYESYVSTSKDIIDNISLGVIRMVYMDPNLFFSFHLIEKYLYVNSDDVELSFEDKALVLEGTGFEIGFDDQSKELWVDELQTDKFPLGLLP